MNCKHCTYYRYLGERRTGHCELWNREAFNTCSKFEREPGADDEL